MTAIMVADAIRHAGLAHVNARREGDTGGCDDTPKKIVRKFERSGVPGARTEPGTGRDEPCPGYTGPEPEVGAGFTPAR